MKLDDTSQFSVTRKEAWVLLKSILSPDKQFFLVLLAYSVAISILSLALPISVQSLINSVATTALLTPLVTLSVILFIVLSFSSMIRALKSLVSEYYQRHFFARLTTEITLRSLYVPYYEFECIHRDKLMNKFFEIVTIQKSLPSLITGVFSITLQTIVGIILSSLYHPVYLIFNIVLIVLLYFIWQSHHSGAASYSIKESTQKHDLAGWLQKISRSHHLLKTQRTKVYAAQKSNVILDKYLASRSAHFRHLFLQICYLLALYVVGNTILLFISGLLVLKGQLSLGQLVATELVFSGIFVNFYRAGDYLVSYYDVIASCHKLRYFFELKLEPFKPKHDIGESFNLSLCDLRYSFRGESIPLTYEFEAGKRYALGTVSSSFKALFRDIILGFKQPTSGYLSVNNHMLHELDIHHYRNHISLIDAQDLLEGDIREYLTFGLGDVSDVTVTNALIAAGLTEKFKQLGIDLDTELHPSGYPLSRTDTFRLKVARSIMEQPKLVIINDYLSDVMIDVSYFERFSSAYAPTTTIIIVSNNIDPKLSLDHVLYLTNKGFHSCQSIKELLTLCHS